MEEDQERYLFEAQAHLKDQSYMITKCIEESDLRRLLKETSLMLCELKTSLLSPKNYYSIWTEVFKEVGAVETHFNEEIRRGRKPKEIYEAVQQASNLIPRLYLMIIAGSCYIDSGEGTAKEIFSDLLNMIKGVQNPLRGLFARYFLLKMLKDKLPDKEQEDGSSYRNSIEFILQNLEEMNRLWIRLSLGCHASEKTQKEKERNELKVLVGENIIRLSSLDSITIELYKEEILPKLISIIKEAKDGLSQQYLMECIIHAFPDDFNIDCIEEILNTCSVLQESVNINSLFIQLMKKLAKFLNDTSRDSKLKMAPEALFEILSDKIGKLVVINSNLPKASLIELQVAFLEFTIKSNPGKIEYINKILRDTLKVVQKDDTELASIAKRKLVNLLTLPLEILGLRIFELPEFPILMRYLDESVKAEYSIKIIEALVKDKDMKIDTVDKLKTLIDFVKPLLLETEVLDEIQFDYDMNTMTKIVHLAKSTDPNLQFNLYKLMKEQFLIGGPKKTIYTLPTLISALLLLISRFDLAYAHRKENVSSDSFVPIVQEFFGLEVEGKTDDDHYNFVSEVYAEVNLLRKYLEGTKSSKSFTFMSASLKTLSELNANKEKFTKEAESLAETLFEFIEEKTEDPDLKYALITQLIGILVNLSILSEDFKKEFFPKIATFSTKLAKRSEQCQVMLNCTHLFYNEYSKNEKKVYDCLNKAKKFADFAMGNPQNLFLYVFLINKHAYFLGKGLEMADHESISDLIELLQNHIQTVRNENEEHTFLNEIEEFFKASISSLERRKAAGEEAFKALNLHPE